ncbi:MAG TPA: hypothetical protein VFN24_07385 [Microbacterium sp.]|nr:hypothetical protein [Microbacterium sp.]
MTPRSKAAAKAEGPAEERAGRVPDDAAVSALLDQLTEGVSALHEALEQGEKARRVRAETTRELLASPELKAMTRQAPEIRKKIASALKEEDRKSAEAEQSIADLDDAAQDWLAELKKLRDLKS